MSENNPYGWAFPTIMCAQCNHTQRQHRPGSIVVCEVAGCSCSFQAHLGPLKQFGEDVKENHEERKTMTQNLVTVKTSTVPVVAPARVGSKEATKHKSYFHPGSYMELPDGQIVDFQYDLNPNEARNGVTDTELLECLVQRLNDFQSSSLDKSNKAVKSMYCPETDRAISKIKEAIDCLNSRQIIRAKQRVQYTDKPHTDKSHDDA